MSSQKNAPKNNRIKRNMIHHVVHSNRTQKSEQIRRIQDREKSLKTKHVKRSQRDQQMSLESNAFSRRKTKYSDYK